MITRFAMLSGAASALALLAACASGPSDAELAKIDTVVVI